MPRPARVKSEFPPSLISYYPTISSSIFSRKFHPLFHTYFTFMPSLSSFLHHLHVSSLRHTSQLHAVAIRHGHIDNPIVLTKFISLYSRYGHNTSLARLVFDFSNADTKTNNVFVWNSILAAYSNDFRFSDTLTLFISMISYTLPDKYTLAIASKAAGEVKSIWMGKKVQSFVEKLGFRSDAVVGNCVMGMYFRCEEFDSGRNMFEQMPERNVASWNSLMVELLKSRNGDCSRNEVWGLFRRMQLEGLKPDGFTLSTLLTLCDNVDDENLNLLLRGREIHGFSTRNGFHLDFHVGSCLIDMYLKSNEIGTGRRVFDLLVSKNVVVWTAMINGCVQHGEFEEALALFRRMQLKDRIIPNRVTLLGVLSAVGSLASLAQGKEIHAFSLKARLYGDVALNNALIDTYFKCGSLDLATRVFYDSSWEKDAISWGSMVCGVGRHGKGKDAIALFREICNLGIKFDHITCVGVISACGQSGLVNEGFDIYNSLMQDHQITVTEEICSAVVDMFCRAGKLDRALDFVNSITLEPSTSTWGALFGYAVANGNREVQDIAYNFLLQRESKSPSNDVVLSNSLASSGKFSTVLELRTRMKEKRLYKVAGCSWICVNNMISYFVVADKSHKNSDVIYALLHDLLPVMKEAGHIPDFIVC